MIIIVIIIILCFIAGDAASVEMSCSVFKTVCMKFSSTDKSKQITQSHKSFSS